MLLMLADLLAKETGQVDLDKVHLLLPAVRPGDHHLGRVANRKARKVYGLSLLLREGECKPEWIADYDMEMILLVLDTLFWALVREENPEIDTTNACVVRGWGIILKPPVKSSL